MLISLSHNSKSTDSQAAIQLAPSVINAIDDCERMLADTTRDEPLSDRRIRLRVSRAWTDMSNSLSEELQLSRKKVRRTVDLLTGHHLNKHFHMIGVVEEPTCRASCKNEEYS